MEKIKARDMKLADYVSLHATGLFDTAIVSNITESDVHLFRPYGTNADFSYTGGVICYVGIEQYSIPRDSQVEYVLLRRTGELR
jgi:hypothetical protein